MKEYTKCPVEALLPHSPPFVLIDRILDYDDSSIKAEVTIREDSLFFDAESSTISSWVGIESMAQCIAALAGIRAKSKDKSIEIGFLLGTRRFITKQSYFIHNKTYLVTAVELFCDESGLASFHCEIQDEFGELTNEAKISVYQTENLKKFVSSRNELS